MDGSAVGVGAGGSGHALSPRHSKVVARVYIYGTVDTYHIMQTATVLLSAVHKCKHGIFMKKTDWVEEEGRFRNCFIPTTDIAAAVEIVCLAHVG